MLIFTWITSSKCGAIINIVFHIQQIKTMKVLFYFYPRKMYVLFPITYLPALKLEPPCKEK